MNDSKYSDLSTGVNSKANKAFLTLKRQLFKNEYFELKKDLKREKLH